MKEINEIYLRIARSLELQVRPFKISLFERLQPRYGNAWNYLALWGLVRNE